MPSNKQIREPLYLKVRKEIKRRIESGEWKEGQLIPGEHALTREFNVSRVTIRQAIKSLVQEQYLKPKAGFGTIVYNNKSSLSNFTLVRSFTNEMNEMGLPSVTITVNLEKVKADNTLASTFNINLGDELYRLSRTRGTIVPILYSETYLLPVVEIPNTQEVLMGSLYQFLASKNIFFSHFEEYVTAVIAPRYIKTLLKVSDDAPELKRKRFSYDDTNRLIEYSETYYNPQHYEYRTTLFYRKK